MAVYNKVLLAALCLLAAAALSQAHPQGFGQLPQQGFDTAQQGFSTAQQAAQGLPQQGFQTAQTGATQGLSTFQQTSRLQSQASGAGLGGSFANGK